MGEDISSFFREDPQLHPIGAVYPPWRRLVENEYLKPNIMKRIPWNGRAIDREGEGFNPGRGDNASFQDTKVFNIHTNKVASEEDGRLRRRG